tara:strand:+ start:794 stop:1297 length:504 start_codon:yes stop_codon:yes gene_type:complete
MSYILNEQEIEKINEEVANARAALKELELDSESTSDPDGNPWTPHTVIEAWFDAAETYNKVVERSKATLKTSFIAERKAGIIPLSQKTKTYGEFHLSAGDYDYYDVAILLKEAPQIMQMPGVVEKVSKNAIIDLAKAGQIPTELIKTALVDNKRFSAKGVKTLSLLI